MTEKNHNNDKSEDSENTQSGLGQLKQQLEYRNPDIFKGIPEEKRHEILSEFVSITYQEEHSHSGPLPSPEAIGKYNTIIPDGADRIMKMAEKQQKHRMTIESSIIKSQSKQSGLGQWFGLIIGIVGIGCGTFLAYSGATTVGGIIAGGTVVSLVSVFVIGRKRQQTKE
ncbi:MAG TPA: DUF2335 domain-containing protein [Flavobacteriaceae bacterium]|nr:DUF2335 domain-containing protein [Flavobacteriaceae bacterium]